MVKAGKPKTKTFLIVRVRRESLVASDICGLSLAQKIIYHDSWYFSCSSKRQHEAYSTCFCDIDFGGCSDLLTSWQLTIRIRIVTMLDSWRTPLPCNCDCRCMMHFFQTKDPADVYGSSSHIETRYKLKCRIRCALDVNPSPTSRRKYAHINRMTFYQMACALEIGGTNGIPKGLSCLELQERQKQHSVVSTRIVTGNTWLYSSFPRYDIGYARGFHRLIAVGRHTLVTSPLMQEVLRSRCCLSGNQRYVSRDSFEV